MARILTKNANGVDLDRKTANDSRPPFIRPLQNIKQGVTKSTKQQKRGTAIHGTPRSLER